MKHVSLESFIKKIADSFSIQNTKRISTRFIGSLLIVTSLVGLSGTITTEAHAPSESEMEEFEATDGFVSEEERAKALEQLAAEVRRIADEKRDILWLARVIYSETKRPEEMPYIAWVVRNRVERGHRSFDYESGTNNYKGAALASSQFSGMHPGLDRNAHHNLSMNYDTVGVPAWDQALKVAEEVYYSDGSDRVLPTDTIYFYSPTVIAPPAWALQSREVHRFNTNRFAFYSPA